MPFFQLITTVSGIVAALCVLGFPLWVLGVPGTENEYARGWKMGFQALMAFPIAWLLLFVPYGIGRNFVGDAARINWQWFVGCCVAALLLLFFGRLIQAFKTMM